VKNKWFIRNLQFVNRRHGLKLARKALLVRRLHLVRNLLLVNRLHLAQKPRPVRRVRQNRRKKRHGPKSGLTHSEVKVPSAAGKLSRHNVLRTE
jgi:hypothetical protein